jgi:hypothetical protein
LSFGSHEELAKAAGLAVENLEIDHNVIGLCVGVSPQLIWRIALNPSRYYRQFTIPKRGGGERQIDSPRIFLKAIQWFLADYVFGDLARHDCVHSYSFGRSIVTNAQNHVGKAFVGNSDIENFFGTISRKSVKADLERQGFTSGEADLISKLCTKNGYLPQGAPTSPALSNSFLFGFDQRINEVCKRKDLRYSRYADDITISGTNKTDIGIVLGLAGSVLRNDFELRLNPQKTRIASRGGQQRVAGVVVNFEAAPPRIFRRRVRAAFHRASQNPEAHLERVGELGGYIGYLKIFPKFEGNKELDAYKAIIANLKRLRREETEQL